MVLKMLMFVTPIPAIVTILWQTPLPESSSWAWAEKVTFLGFLIIGWVYLVRRDGEKDKRIVEQQKQLDQARVDVISGLNAHIKQLTLAFEALSKSEQTLLLVPDLTRQLTSEVQAMNKSCQSFREHYVTSPSHTKR